MGAAKHYPSSKLPQSNQPKSQHFIVNEAVLVRDEDHEKCWYAFGVDKDINKNKGGSKSNRCEAVQLHSYMPT